MRSLLIAAGLLGGADASCTDFWIFKFCTERDGEGSKAEPPSRGLIRLPKPPQFKDFRFDVNKLKALSEAKKINTDPQQFYKTLPESAVQRDQTLTLSNGLFEPPQCVGEKSEGCPTTKTHIPPQGVGSFGGANGTGSCYAISERTCSEADKQQAPICAAGARFESACAAKKAGFAGCEHLITPAMGNSCPPVDAKAALDVAAFDLKYTDKEANTSTIEVWRNINVAAIESLSWLGPWAWWDLSDRTCRHEYRRYGTYADEVSGSPNPVQRFEFVGSTQTGGETTRPPACDVDPSNVCTSGYVMRRCEPNCDNLGTAASEMRETSVQAYKFFTESMYKQHVLANVDGDTVPGEQIVVAEWTNEDSGICGDAEHMRGFGGASADPNLAWSNWYVKSSSTANTLRDGRMLVHAFPHTLSMNSGINLKTELEAQVRAAMDDEQPDASNSVSVTVTSFNALTVKVTSKLSFPWYLPDPTIKLTVKLRLYHHGTKLQVVVYSSSWSWTAGGLGLPNGVADDVSDGAQDALDQIKVELAEGILEQLVDALGGGPLLDASFATFAFFDLDGTVASLINL